MEMSFKFTFENYIRSDEIRWKNSRIGEEADTSDQRDFDMKPRKLGVVDFGESTLTTFCIVERIIRTGLVGSLVDGRWCRRLFLVVFAHDE